MHVSPHARDLSPGEWGAKIAHADSGDYFFFAGKYFFSIDATTT